MNAQLKESNICNNILYSSKKMDEIIIGVEQKVYGLPCKLRYTKGVLKNIFVYNSKDDEFDIYKTKRFKNIFNVPVNVSGNLSGVISGTLAVSADETAALLHATGLFGLNQKGINDINKNFMKAMDKVYNKIEKEYKDFIFMPYEISYDGIDKGWAKVFHGDIRGEIEAFGFELSSIYTEKIGAFKDVNEISDFIEESIATLKGHDFITRAVDIYIASAKHSLSTGVHMGSLETTFKLSKVTGLNIRKIPSGKLKVIVSYDEGKSVFYGMEEILKNGINTDSLCLFMRPPFSNRSYILTFDKVIRPMKDLTCACGYKFKKSDYKKMLTEPFCPKCSK